MKVLNAQLCGVGPIGCGGDTGRDVKDRSSFWCVTCVPPVTTTGRGRRCSGVGGTGKLYIQQKRARAGEFIDRASGRDRLQRIAAGCFYALAAAAHNASTPKTQNTPSSFYTRVLRFLSHHGRHLLLDGRRWKNASMSASSCRHIIIYQCITLL